MTYKLFNELILSYSALNNVKITLFKFSIIFRSMVDFVELFIIFSYAEYPFDIISLISKE